MQKAKKYDWKDSNLALFGSDTEKNVKKGAAETEPAWAAVTACKEPNKFVWRIEKFKVKEWPREDYGKFYSGDSYIVLNVYKEPGSDELEYDVHFWIGKNSTQDEYATAAYKTVEIDTLLDDKPIQHREVQGYESDMFKSYFDTIVIMKGGCATGFRHVEAKKYEPRLLHFQSLKKRHCAVTEVKFTRKALNSNDVFIIDNGTEAYQWNGKLCNKDEKIKAAQFLQQLESERCGKCKTEAYDEDEVSENHKIMQLLPDIPYERKDVKDEQFRKTLFRLSDESGKINFSIISEGTAPKDMIDEKDVYIIDNGKKLFVYVGGQTSETEKKNAMSYAHNYLMKSTHPMIPVTCLHAGQKSKEFDELLDN